MKTRQRIEGKKRPFLRSALLGLVQRKTGGVPPVFHLLPCTLLIFLSEAPRPRGGEPIGQVFCRLSSLLFDYGYLLLDS